MRKQLMVFLVLAVTVGLAAGCIFSPKDTTPAPPQPGPPNDTPENAIKRFVWAYENRKGPEYENMFTEDFTFEFSNLADPTLAQKYSAGWFKTDEQISARNLFQGFSNEQGLYTPAASSIDMTLAQTNPINDTEGRDSTKFKMLATRVDGIIIVPPSQGQTQETRYIIDNNNHRFYLARGDAQFDSTGRFITPAGERADSTRWYIYRWIDETAQPVAVGGLQSASAAVNRVSNPLATWGEVKAASR